MERFDAFFGVAVDHSRSGGTFICLDDENETIVFSKKCVPSGLRVICSVYFEANLGRNLAPYVIVESIFYDDIA